MRTNFPPTEAGPSARSSLRRALLLSVLLVIVWSAIAFLPDPELPSAVPPAQTEQNVSSLSGDASGVATAGPGVDADASRAGTDDPGTSADATAALETGGSSPDPGSLLDTGLLAPAARSLFGPGYMLVLVLLAVAGVWALWLKGRKTSPSGHGQLTKIGQFKLGPQQDVHLVRCADEVLLLGVTNGSINLLKAYPSDAFPDEAKPAAPESPTLAAALVQIASSFRATHTARKAERAALRHNSDRLPSHPSPEEDLPPGVEIPEWTIATASAISDGPDFMHVLRRYASKKTYKANTLYPPTGASN